MSGPRLPARRETEHAVSVGDARALPLPDDSVDLVVTSPPYPMIEQWDEPFAELRPAIGEALASGDGDEAFDRMHAVLADAWAELDRVLVDGGVACVNVGDATRSLDGRFRLYPNHARIAEAFAALGFDQLPGVLWRKPTNSPTKFMGSGTLPPNAYVTLEHEHVLVFRRGGRREFPPHDADRYGAAYFWEERNRWFSDVWEDLRGVDQTLGEAAPRDRSGAFPFELPYRLVSMFSTYGDTVLDPFWGTGTTSLAAMAAARNSVGVERNPGFAAAFEDALGGLSALAEERGRRRLREHREFLAGRDARPEYDAQHYDFRVVTKGERSLRLYGVTDVVGAPGGYRVHHRALDGS
ncbi:DNA-methyltransferase [Halorarum salinum]|uniref:Type II methyltransferase n=1 Tax=Halorarum salinum TaxID=2743089 RepID=A0A7D5QHT0_9EURY|nr:site-specific DNA-methyltransferase [Halobaculum salinum]QLG62982.1 site-specific DNA-methyltransferase [Halobaculum salinum]